MKWSIFSCPDYDSLLCYMFLVFIAMEFELTNAGS